jgi:predicted dehydrogenase
VAPVRFALVGYGTGGRRFHAPLIASVPSCRLAAVVTTSPARRSQVRTEHPETEVVDSLADLAAHGIDAVAISTPADTHSTLTDEALTAGLHVVCDKPFALDAEAAQRSAERAARLGRCLSPYQNRRWDSDFLTVRALVEAGTLGRITRLESRFERYAPERGPRPSGGGTLLDFGSHLVDQALLLLGPVESVYAEWRTRDNGLDDDVFVALTHSSGARSHLHGGWTQAAPVRRFHVTGLDAAYVVDGPMDGQEAHLVRGESPATVGDAWGREPEERWGRLWRGETSEVVPTLPGRWPDFYAQFATAVRGEGPVPVPAQEAVTTATVLDAARRSASERRVVQLGVPAD